MDSGLATLLAGIFSGVTVGLIGALSAILSYRMAQRQADRSMAESEMSRRHSLAQLALPKRLEAAERVWRILFIMEHRNELSAEDEDQFISAQMWLPHELRKKCLDLLVGWCRAKSDTRAADMKDQIRACRQGLIEITVVELLEREEFTNEQ